MADHHGVVVVAVRRVSQQYEHLWRQHEDDMTHPHLLTYLHKYLPSHCIVPGGVPGTAALVSTFLGPEPEPDTEPKPNAKDPAGEAFGTGRPTALQNQRVACKQSGGCHKKTGWAHGTRL